jgi:lysophosphatidylcholine acyltransferase/lyso-PAF acetyltransferase
LINPSAHAQVLEAMNLRAKDSRFPRMCIFPEGTTTNGENLMLFKKGAFASGMPVTPLLLT